ncbi:MAG: S8 family serine peptidase [Deltaproteobacteria bacterium]|nr:S8 family serine peptidase [Deltaproteobacteria bacterium]
MKLLYRFFWLYLKGYQIVAAIFCGICLLSSAFAADLPPAAPGEYIIKVNQAKLAAIQANTPELKGYTLDEIKKALHSLIGLEVKKNILGIRADVVRTKSGGINLDILQRFLEEGIIKYIEPNYQIRLKAITNDTYVGTQWALNNTGQESGTPDIDLDAPEAWALDNSTNEVVVGVVDTGVDYRHPDLLANLWVNPRELPGNNVDDDNNGVVDDIYGYNAIKDNGAPLDDHGHGTHCAGIIGAVANNGKGVAGIARNVKIMALRFMDKTGAGYVSDAVEAIEYGVFAKQSGVNLRVLSNSWAGEGDSSALKEAVQFANSNGISFIVAAGNESNNNDVSPLYPSNYNIANVITVAAISNNGSLAYFSNYGPNSVHVAAPGVNILSTVLNGGYQKMSGTSMATPYVAGVAALVYSKLGSVSPTNVKSLIMSNTVQLDSLTGKVASGGMVNAYKALMGEINSSPVIATIANQTMFINNGSKTLTLKVSDPDGDPLTLSVGFNVLEQQARQLDAELGLWSNGNYYVNSWGYNEKWIRDKNDFWYFILPNGYFYRYEEFNSVPLISTLSKVYYQDPKLLYQAAESSSAPATLSLIGRRLTITPRENYIGKFTVQVAASDGKSTSYRTFTVTVVKNTAPYIGDISTKNAYSGKPLSISIYVRDPDNDEVNITATSDQGSNIKLSVTRATLTITPDESFSGEAMITLTAADVIHQTVKSFLLRVQQPQPSVDDGLLGDTDGDGISDYQEIEDGTNSEDRGSYLTRFGGTGYGVWNGFLGMSNVLEVANNSYNDGSFRLVVYNQNGGYVAGYNYGISAQSVRHITLNEIKGFKADSYGIIKITSTLSLDGRVSYYRPNVNNEFDFAYNLPLSSPLRGNSSVGFNTYQPSTNVADAGQLVQNWLSIINLANGQRKFRVSTYDQSGNRLAVRTVTLGKLSRVDLDGGHGLLAGPAAGFHEITPLQASSPYLAQIIRYGSDSQTAVTGQYSFAFPLFARSGSGEKQYLLVSNKNGDDNWVEIVNTKNVSSPVEFILRASTGKLIKRFTFNLAPRSQRHINVSRMLSADSIGTAEVNAGRANTVIIQSMHYFRDAANGLIKAMYGTQGRETNTNSLVGNFNLFLDMENLLRISNTTSDQVIISVQIDGNSQISTKRYIVNPHAALEVPLHDIRSFGIRSGSYGSVLVQATKGAGIISEILRIRHESSGSNLDFVAPTMLQ